jgi:hypothetical protein
MKNLLYPLTAIILSFPTYCNAQINKTEYPKSVIQLSGLSDQQKLKELVSIHQGTYQLSVSNENYAPVLTLDLLESVINSRQQATNVSIELDEFTHLFIPSFNAIENEIFVPLKTIIYPTNPTSVGVSD